jgi:hypothetical protein
MEMQIPMQNPPQFCEEIPKAMVCLRAERLGEWMTAALTLSTFSGVLMDLRRPCVSLLSELTVASNCLTLDRIVFA